jgi:putative membrane protein
VVNTHATSDAPPRTAIALVSLAVIGAVVVVTRGGHQHSAGPVPGVLPTMNAAANATSAILLTTGWIAIRRRLVRTHRACMLAALAASTLFLVGYLLHHARVGSVPFAGPASLRPFYFAVLIPHVVLSAVVLPLALTTVWWAWRGRFATHRRIARWTLPLWLYVSVSGVAVYWMLYRL